MISEINAELRANIPFPPETKFNLAFDFKYLLEHGFVIPVIIQTPAFLCATPISKSLRTITVMALLDTGASRTCISEEIANDLELEAIGFTQMSTAAGINTFTDYIVDVLFPNAGLKGSNNLKVSSCKLPYNRNLPKDHIMAKSNFGVLIGRDMMTRWNIVWNGPSSSVYIAE